MSTMPTTLTLKNVPDALYTRLKQSAEIHRRSLNNEAIACLETVLQSQRMSTDERLQRIRDLRSTLPKTGFRARDIEALRKQGRP